ncbi:Variable outer membrane protein (plasmid) [Borrelia coriaceae ATCC 43381]|uniref:Variable large protein n=1 Tax=Borrelia coriaceae ATCC 43381 TaxID=1408429 RepID=W5SVK8_9SPIR|nr:Variable outer membrane protein [Borrelia coriaceae ATCC 43381]
MTKNIKNIRLKRICATLFISLFLSCNNSGEELEKHQNQNNFLSSLANLGNDFLSVFTYFGDSLGGVLAFDKTTTKSEVGKYFKKVQDTVQGTKDALNKIVEDMEKEHNRNASGTKAAVKTLNEKLDKIIEGAKIASEAIGIDGTDPIANVSVGVGAKGEAANLIKGIKGGIVEVVLQGKGNAEAGDGKKAEDGSVDRVANAGEAGKLFGNSGGGAISDASNAKKQQWMQQKLFEQ